jgi:hypothetical protein
VQIDGFAAEMSLAGHFGDAPLGIALVISGISLSLQEASEVFEHLLQMRADVAAGAVGGELTPRQWRGGGS